MTKRAEFSKQVRRDAFARAAGRCEECAKKLGIGEPAEFHHILESYLGGKATLENVQVLCRACHDEITRFRRGEIDKTRRLADKRMGIKRKSRPMPGSKASGWKRRMNGQAERRT